MALIHQKQWNIFVGATWFLVGCAGDLQPNETASIQPPLGARSAQDESAPTKEPFAARGISDSEARSEKSNERRGEVHPNSPESLAEPAREKDFRCPPPGTPHEDSDPLEFLRTLKGSEIILTPKGSKPAWQVIFSKDYVAVQDLATWSEDGLLAICSGTDELILVDAKDIQAPELISSVRPSTEMKELEPEAGWASHVNARAYFESEARKRPFAFADARSDSRKSVSGGPSGEKEVLNKYGRCEHIAREGNILYFAHRSDQFRHHGYIMAFDISTSPPRRLGYHTVPKESFSGLAVRDGVIAAAAHENGLMMFQLSDEFGLQKLSSLPGISNAWDVDLYKGWAVVANGKNGIALVNIKDPKKPTLTSQIALPGFAKSIVVSEGTQTAYVALGLGGVAAIQLTDPKKPRVLWIENTPGTAIDVDLNGNLLALADWTSARLFDVSTPKAPLQVGVESTGGAMGRALSVALRDDALFVGDWTGVHILRPHPTRRAPHAAFDRGVAKLGSVKPGESARVEVTIRNEGRAPLLVSEGGFQGDGFKGEIPSFSLQPKESKLLSVTFTPTDESTDSRGTLVLCTNDPDAPELTLPLRANPSKFGVGRPLPDIGLTLQDRKPWLLSEERGKPVLLAYFATF